METAEPRRSNTDPPKKTMKQNWKLEIPKKPILAYTDVLHLISMVKGKWAVNLQVDERKKQEKIEGHLRAMLKSKFHETSVLVIFLRGLSPPRFKLGKKIST